MNRIGLIIYFLSILSVINFGQNKQSERQNKKAFVEPLLLDKSSLSGIDIPQITAPWDPERRLFQKPLFIGKEISVFIDASETKTAFWQNYGIEEFNYIINGQARLRPFGGEDIFYPTGTFFMTPRGYDGELETQGGHSYYQSLSVITNERPLEIIKSLPPKPFLVEADKLSGINLSYSKNSTVSELFIDTLYSGYELCVWTESRVTSTEVSMGNLPEQLVYIISGTVRFTLQNGIEKTFYTGDFLVIPQNFVGQISYQGQKLFRSLHVKKS